MSRANERPAVEPEYLTVAEAAAFARLSRAEVYRMLRRGQFPSILTGSGGTRRRIPREGLRRALEAGRVQR